MCLDRRRTKSHELGSKAMRGDNSWTDRSVLASWGNKETNSAGAEKNHRPSNQNKGFVRPRYPTMDRIVVEAASRNLPFSMFLQPYQSGEGTTCSHSDLPRLPGLQASHSPFEFDKPPRSSCLFLQVHLGTNKVMARWAISPRAWA